jgi:hypothetical protein
MSVDLDNTARIDIFVNPPHPLSICKSFETTIQSRASLIVLRQAEHGIRARADDHSQPAAGYFDTCASERRATVVYSSWMFDAYWLQSRSLLRLIRFVQPIFSLRISLKLFLDLHEMSTCSLSRPGCPKEALQEKRSAMLCRSRR